MEERQSGRRRSYHTTLYFFNTKILSVCVCVCVEERSKYIMVVQKNLFPRAYTGDRIVVSWREFDLTPSDLCIQLISFESFVHWISNIFRRTQGLFLLEYVIKVLF